MDDNNLPSEQVYNSPDTHLNSLSIMCDGGVETEGQPTDLDDTDCHVRIENLGGITSTEITIPSGISLLVGQNASNRSSFLRSIAAGLGGEASAARLKSDADSGNVKLRVANDSYGREYKSNLSSIQKHGSPYTDELDIVDNFVALFTDLPARRAVERGDDLREILMQPVDTSDIQSRITDLKQERSQLDQTIQQAESREQELPQLEEKRSNLETELSSVKGEIAELESVVENVDQREDSSSETERLRSELESLRTELSNTERQADEIKQQLEFRRTEREELIEERDELEEDIEEFGNFEAIETEVSNLATEIEQQNDLRGKLEQTIEDLQSVIQVNKNFLDGDMDLIDMTDEQSVTDALDPESQRVECWACGTDVKRATFNERIEALREMVAQQRSTITEIDDRISNLEDRQKTLKKKSDEYNEKIRRIDELGNRIQKHTEKIEQLEADYERQQSEVDRLEKEIADVETEIEQADTDNDEGSDEFIETHKELTKLERKRGRLENQLEETVSEIETIEALNEDRVDAETRREEVAEELEELRSRIERLEVELIQTLNSIMEDLIKQLQYDNIERVWLERKISDGTTVSSFELHIIREAEDGSVYEDTVDTLSESEREIIGIVVGLSGYLVHHIDRTVPFLLLDSVEMIDGDRLAALLEYIEMKTEVEFLMVALLPKDAKSVKEAGILDSYTTIDFQSIEI